MKVAYAFIGLTKQKKIATRNSRTIPMLLCETDYTGWSIGARRSWQIVQIQRVKVQPSKRRQAVSWYNKKVQTYTVNLGFTCTCSGIINQGNAHFTGMPYEWNQKFDHKKCKH